MHAFLFQFEVPRWTVMWGLAGVVYASAKLLTWVYRRPTIAPIWKHVGYLVAWPGMDVDAFLNEHCRVKPTPNEWWFAIGKTISGILLLFMSPSFAELGTVFAGWAGMCGIVFVLHFGLFHLLSCGWRAAGVESAQLMIWPIAAQSPADFWNNRWNRAFHDLAGRFLFRPLIRRLGPAWALMATFIASGVVHDLVMSVPAGGGYGLPTLYFAFQGGAILGQHRLTRAEIPLGRVRGWLFTFAVVVLPCPLLLHPWFVDRVIVPFLQALESYK